MKDWLKTKSKRNFRSWHPPPTAWQPEGEKVETVTGFLFLAPKSLWMVTAAMKSDDDCFLAGKQ